MPQHFNISLRHRTRGKWTPEKRALAINMAHDGSLNAEIAKAVGLSIASVNMHLNGCNRPIKKAIDQKRVSYVSAVERAPSAVLEERERRKAAADRRDYTAIFCNDPPPGYSALDQKRAGS